MSIGGVSSGAYAEPTAEIVPPSTGRIYVATGHGSLYRTPDDGITWNLITGHGFGGTNVLQLAVYANGPDSTTDVIYLYNTFDATLRRSVDGGATWTTVTIPGGGGGNPQVAPDGTVFIDSFYMSFDQGDTWETIVDSNYYSTVTENKLWGGYSDTQIARMDWFGDPPELIDVVNDWNSGPDAFGQTDVLAYILGSESDSSTFLERVVNTTVIDITPPTTIIYAFVDALTNDGGMTILTLIIEEEVTNPHIGQIWRSVDGGDSWTKVLESGDLLPYAVSKRGPFIAYDPATPTNWYVLGGRKTLENGVDAVVHRSLDNGVTWDPRIVDVGEDDLRVIRAVTDPGLIVEPVFEWDIIALSEGAACYGINLTLGIYQDLLNGFTVAHPHVLDGGIKSSDGTTFKMFGAQNFTYANRRTITTTDKGDNWATITPTVSTTPSSISSPFVFDVNEVYFNDGSGLWKSTDGGASFSQVMSGTIFTTKVGGNHIWYRDAAGTLVFYTTSRTSPSFPGTSVNSGKPGGITGGFNYFLAQDDGSYALFDVNISGTRYLYKVTTAGVWTQVATLIASVGAASGIFVSKDGVTWIGGVPGTASIAPKIIRSTNSGASWTTVKTFTTGAGINGHVGSTTGRQQSIMYRGSGEWFAIVNESGSGKDIYRSLDDGVTWTVLPRHTSNVDWAMLGQVA